MRIPCEFGTGWAMLVESLVAWWTRLVGRVPTVLASGRWE